MIMATWVTFNFWITHAQITAPASSMNANERKASVRSKDSRSAGRYCCNHSACASMGAEKFPASPGIKANKAQIPAVMPRDIFNALTRTCRSKQPLRILFSVYMPNNGMVTCSTTNIIEGTLNLLYKGT